MIKAGACYLEHVCIAVVGVLHHHRLGSRQSVRDAVLVFVAYGLERQKEEIRSATKAESNPSLKMQKTELSMFSIKNTSDISPMILAENNRCTREGWRCVIINWINVLFGQLGPHTGLKRTIALPDCS